MNGPLWKPSAERIEHANLTRFVAMVKAEYAPEVSDYPSLYRWSIQRPEEFWPAVWRFCGVKSSRSWESVLVEGHRMLGARWFMGSRLNFAENLLHRRDDEPALIFMTENGAHRSLSFKELYTEVARLAQALRAAGVVAGDRVVGYLSNLPETVIAMLATTSLGALWSACSPDFGVNAVVERFGQIRPKVMFAVDGYFYNGKTIDCLPRIREILNRLPEVKRVVLVPCLTEPDIRGLPNGVLYRAFLGQENVGEIKFVQLPFDFPVYILYSSGTTGPPKCIVHGAGGTLLQHLKELTLHTDLKTSDRLFYYTTCGWMMWNWLVSGLAVGATVLLYDGSPFYPGPDALFRFAEVEGMTVFGASAKYYAAIEKAGLKPGRNHDLSRLRTVLSTGSPLAPESFDYVYRAVKADVQISSISGGTDLISCFALGNPILPVYRGELQCRGLGMKVEVFNDEGTSVVGEKGELVCTAPFPSMPEFFWNDPDGMKYRRAYFEKYPGVWAHGDYAEITEHGGMIIYGRSDAVLNPGGVRIGTAEIYRVVERVPEVLESIAVGQDWKDDVRIVLFVKLRDNLTLDESLIQTIKAKLRADLSPRHVPAKILQVHDIPRTVSGKLVELAVRNVIHNRPIKNIEALANPEALEYFRNRAELAGN